MKKLGTIVKIKKGVYIPTLNIDQTGWCGRIVDRGIDPMIGVYFKVEWDSLTLQNIGFKNIFRIYKNNLDWKSDIFCRHEVVKVKERDTIEDVVKQRKLIEFKIQRKDNKIAQQVAACGGSKSQADFFAILGCG